MSFGWKKLFGLQFEIPVSVSGMPMNQQTGEWLTWYYFGHSIVFGSNLALIQIIGSFGLLFRKTLLPAAIGLFTFMFNLLLINIFYEMNAGALTQSILLTLGIAFLIMSDYKIVLAFILKQCTTIPGFVMTSTVVKNIFRVSTIILSLLFTMYLKYKS